MTNTKPKTVYQAIVACSADIAETGISKDRKNVQQGYIFRGIDDVYNAMAPILSKHGLVILPRVLNRNVIERMNKSGGALFYTTIEVEFDFISADDGSKHIVKTYGEAMDSGDKSTNKAMSAAYKYACMQAFCIPTEGDNDADSTTYEVVAKEPEPKKESPQRIKIIGWKKELDAMTDYETVMNFSRKITKDMNDLSIDQVKFVNDMVNKKLDKIQPQTPLDA